MTPCEKQALVFFVDLVGSSAVSSERPILSYWEDYVRPFYVAIERTFAQYCRHPATRFKFLGMRDDPDVMQLSYRGDELVGFILFPPKEDLFSEQIQVAVGEVVRSLYTLKLFWLASSYNLSRIKEGQRPRDISAGIHIGPINLLRGRHNDPKERYHVGYAINLAKRVEGASRLGDASHIFATGEIYSVADAARRRNAELMTQGKALLEIRNAIMFRGLEAGKPEQFKGIDPCPDVCELALSSDALPVFDMLRTGGLKDSVKLMQEAIGSYLRAGGSEENRWAKDTDRVDDTAMEFLFKHMRSQSSLWFQGDVALLLTAWGHWRSQEALELVCSRLKDGD